MGRPRKPPLYTHCAQCGTPLPGGRRADARFCASGGPNSCKDAYHNAHKARDVATHYTTTVPSADGQTDVTTWHRDHGALPISVLAGDAALDQHAVVVTDGDDLTPFVTEGGVRVQPLAAAGVQSSVVTRANDELERKDTAPTVRFRPYRPPKPVPHSEARRIRSLIAEGLSRVAIALSPRDMAVIRRDDRTLADALLRGRLDNALAVIAEQTARAATHSPEGGRS